MSLQPLWPLWLLAIVAIGLGALAGWQIVRTRGALRLAWVRRLAVIGMLTAIGLGPSVEERVSDALLTNAEVYFVIDRTGSMAAQDFGADGATRLSGVAADVDQLTRIIPAAQYSILAFDSQASRQLPLTSDARAVRSWAATMRQEVTSYSAGSAIDRPLEMLQQALERAAERNPQNVRLVFLFSDGENTRGSASDPDDIASYAPLAPVVDGGAVLGYGTPEGGQMLRYTGAGEPTEGDWIIDARTQEPAVSKLDEAQLRQVAADLGITYQHRFDDSSLEPIIDGINLEEVASDGRRDAVVYRGVYWIGAVALAGLLAWEGWDLLRQVPGRRRAGETERGPAPAGPEAGAAAPEGEPA